MIDTAQSADGARGGFGSAVADKGSWKTHWTAAYYDGDWTAEQIDAGLAGLPSDVREQDGNILVTAGITLLLNLLIGAGGTVYNNANAFLGIGDSSTAAAIGQTDLQAATNKVRKLMDASYPSVATNVVTFRSTFATSEGNFSIQEQATFNAAAAGTMLNRKVSDLGTKTAASTLQLTMTVTIT
ncbi:MAG: hypothetical protein M3R61_00150 [Chloroflexota bacterium]|nr:hypothetical protein [Chloroflexota bacterium]